MTQDWCIVVLDCGLKFFVNRNIMVKLAGFFEAMFRHGSVWKDVSTGTIHLTECVLSTFLVFADWVNTGHVDMVEKSSDEPQKDESFQDSQGVQGYGQQFLWATKNGVMNLSIGMQIEMLMDAWNFGRFLLCPAFQNTVMNELIKAYSRDAIPIYNILSIIQDEDESSALRRMVLDAIHFKVGREVLAKADSSYVISEEIIIDIARLSLDEHDGPDRRLDWYAYQSDYHVHPDSTQQCPCPEPRLSSTERFDINGNMW